MIEHRLGRLRNPAEVPLLLLLFLLRHYVSQLDIPLIAHLASERQSLHLVPLVLEF